MDEYDKVQSRYQNYVVKIAEKLVELSPQEKREYLTTYLLHVIHVGDRLVEQIQLVTDDYLAKQSDKASSAKEKTETALKLDRFAYCITKYISMPLGDENRKIEWLEAATKAARLLSNELGEAKFLNGLGRLHHRQGNYVKALEYYQSALVIRQNIGSWRDVARTLNNIAVTYAALGEKEKALEYYWANHKTYAALSEKKSGRATALNNIAETYASLDKYQEALEYHQQALELRTGPRGKGRSLHNLASIYAKLGDTQKAVEILQEALIYRRKAMDALGEATTLNKLGILKYERGEQAEGLLLLQQSFVLLQELGSLKAIEVHQQIELLKSGRQPVEIGELEQPEADD